MRMYDVSFFADDKVVAHVVKSELSEAYPYMLRINTGSEAFRAPSVTIHFCSQQQFEEFKNSLTRPTYNKEKTSTFTNNEDGTVTDNSTGLVFLRNVDCCSKLMSWYSATEFCGGLKDGTCGLTDKSKVGDWRLPTVNELTSLTLRKEVPFKDVLFWNLPTKLLKGSSYYCWANLAPFPKASKTTYGLVNHRSPDGLAAVIDDVVPYANVVDINKGDIISDYKFCFHHVWPVRNERRRNE